MSEAKHRNALGRGLGDLIQRTDPALATSDPNLVAAPAGARFAEINVAEVAPNPKQPREVFDEEALAELVASISEVGLLQPIVVRPIGSDKYELVMGERRLRASQAAGLSRIPAIIRRTEDANLLRDALLENLHRVALNPLEEAAAYQQMLSDFGCTQEELATRIKRSRPQISNTIRLLQLPPAVQRRVAAGVLSAGHARAILTLTDATAMERLATRVVAEGLSVRATEEIAAVGEPGRPRASRARASSAKSALADELERSLTDTLDTRVLVSHGRSKGRIVIEFADQDDLARLADLLKDSLSAKQ